MMWDLSFYRGKRVFITGHTGFKGSWLCRILQQAGAVVTGYAEAPPTDPSLFTLARIGEGMTSVIGDVADLSHLWEAFATAHPEIVLHLAAQPIVGVGYSDPVRTYRTNVMGTVNILECVRRSGTVRSFLNVTTDKVYENREWVWGYRENDRLDGFDPYSNSKSCSELITGSYQRSFFADSSVAISTVRAGNVIGGGDFAQGRIIPDCVRAAVAGQALCCRAPHSVRPYQHVLEPLLFYLILAREQYQRGEMAGSYNVGPDESGCMTTEALVSLFADAWGDDFSWTKGATGLHHEAHALRLDCAKAKQRLGWQPIWELPTAVDRVVAWTRTWLAGGDVRACMDGQIAAYLTDAKEKSNSETDS